jgi:hypothetical protein
MSKRKLSHKELYEIACETGHSFCTTDYDEIQNCLKIMQAEDEKLGVRLGDNRDEKTRLQNERNLEDIATKLQSQLSNYAIEVGIGVLRPEDLKSYKDIGLVVHVPSAFLKECKNDCVEYLRSIEKEDIPLYFRSCEMTPDQIRRTRIKLKVCQINQNEASNDIRLGDLDDNDTEYLRQHAQGHRAFLDAKLLAQ